MWAQRASAAPPLWTCSLACIIFSGANSVPVAFFSLHPTFLATLISWGLQCPFGLSPHLHEFHSFVHTPLRDILSDLPNCLSKSVWKPAWPHNSCVPHAWATRICEWYPGLPPVWAVASLPWTMPVGALGALMAEPGGMKPREPGL